MSNVLLLGAFGQGNPGDEALCAAFCTALAHHDVTIASSDPRQTARRFGTAAIAAEPVAVARAVRDADAIVVGGGTVFKRLGSSTGRARTALLANTAALIAGAHATGGRVAMVGVGAGDLRGRAARSLARWIVANTDLLILRDEESAAVLSDVGAASPFWIAADPAWVLFDPPLHDEGHLPERRTITVALSHHAGDPLAMDALVESLRPLTSEWLIRLQPWQHDAAGRDHELAAAMRERLGCGEIIPPPTDLDDAVATFAGDDLVIGLRFHALVAAAAAGTRFVAVAHEPKLAGIAMRMQQASVPAHAPPEVLAATIAWALANEPPPAAAIEGEMDAARVAFQLLDLLLAEGEVERPDQLATLGLSTGRGAW